MKKHNLSNEWVNGFQWGFLFGIAGILVIMLIVK